MVDSRWTAASKTFQDPSRSAARDRSPMCSLYYCTRVTTYCHRLNLLQMDIPFNCNSQSRVQL